MSSLFIISNIENTNNQIISHISHMKNMVEDENTILSILQNVNSMQIHSINIFTILKFSLIISFGILILIIIYIYI